MEALADGSSDVVPSAELIIVPTAQTDLIEITKATMSKTGTLTVTAVGEPGRGAHRECQRSAGARGEPRREVPRAAGAVAGYVGDRGGDQPVRRLHSGTRSGRAGPSSAERIVGKSTTQREVTNRGDTRESHFSRPRTHTHRNSWGARGTFAAVVALAMVPAFAAPANAAGAYVFTKVADSVADDFNPQTLRIAVPRSTPPVTSPSSPNARAAEDGIYRANGGGGVDDHRRSGAGNWVRPPRQRQPIDE